jgi:hypothetical protein
VRRNVPRRLTIVKLRMHRPIARAKISFTEVELFHFVLAVVSALWAPNGIGPSQPAMAVDLVGRVEVSSAKVRRENAPDRELTLTVITISPAQPDPAVKTDPLFVVEDDEKGRLLPKLNSTSRVVFKNGTLAVWRGTSGGWFFAPRALQGRFSPPGPLFTVVPVGAIGRYEVLRGATSHGEIARKVFSGKRDNQ